MRTYLKLMAIWLLLIPCFVSAKTIILIGNPRSLTTAFTRYFINRGDFNVCHEPISWYNYSKALNKPLPWNVSAYMANIIEEFDKNRSVDSILQTILDTNNGNLLIKEIASNLHDSKLLCKIANNTDIHFVFLIRAPQQAVLSLYKLSKKEPDYGFNAPQLLMNYSYMRDLYYSLKKQNAKIILIDADDLAVNSKTIIPKLCDIIGISYDPQKLQWNSNPNLYGAKDTWMKEIAYSTGFQLPSKRHSIKDPEFSAEDCKVISDLIARNQPIYEELIAYKIEN